MNNNEQISKSRIGRLLNSQTAIDFYGRRKVGFIAAIVIVIITLVSLFTQGLNLGLDFEGGNAWDVPASDTFDIHEADQVLRDHGIDTAGARIQRRSSESADVVTVQIEEVSNEKSASHHGRTCRRRRRRRSDGQRLVHQFDVGPGDHREGDPGAGRVLHRRVAVHQPALRMADGGRRVRRHGARRHRRRGRVLRVPVRRQPRRPSSPS